MRKTAPFYVQVPSQYACASCYDPRRRETILTIVVDRRTFSTTASIHSLNRPSDCLTGLVSRGVTRRQLFRSCVGVKYRTRTLHGCPFFPHRSGSSTRIDARRERRTYAYGGDAVLDGSGDGERGGDGLEGAECVEVRRGRVLSPLYVPDEVARPTWWCVHANDKVVRDFRHDEE